MNESRQNTRKRLFNSLREYGEKVHPGFTLHPIKTTLDSYYQIPVLFNEDQSFIRKFREIGNGIVDPSLPQLYSIEFSTLDGYTFTLGVPPSYDPNRDTTVPNEIFGVRDPASEERRNQVRKGRRFYLPRQIKPLQRQSLEFWVEHEKSLSELRSKYPHLTVRPVWGKLSAREALGVILYFYDEKRLRFYDSIIGTDLHEKLKAQAQGHNYQGKWHLIGRLLQLGGSGALTYLAIVEQYPSERSRQSLIRLGREYLRRTYLILNDNPPKEKQRKRGYSDKGSRKLSHENHEPKNLKLEVEIANNGELEATDPRKLIQLYLYGGLMPRKHYYTPGPKQDVDSMEIWKENNRKQNETRRAKEKQLQEKNGPVEIIQPKQK